MRVIHFRDNTDVDTTTTLPVGFSVHPVNIGELRCNCRLRMVVADDYE